MTPAAKITSENALQEHEQEEKEQSSPPQLTTGGQSNSTTGGQSKSKLRQSLEASQALRKPEGDSTEKLLQYLINKQELTDEWGKELALAQDSKNTYLRNALKIHDSRFDHLEDMLQKQSALQSAQFEKILLGQSQQSQSTKQRGFEYRSTSPKVTFETPGLTLDDANAKEVKKERFRESDIGYFDPYYPESNGKGDYVAAADKIIYRNV